MASGRKYVAISIKHSSGNLIRGRFTLWGYKRTQDDEKRCFSGYVDDIDKCEIYSLEDFRDTYGNGCIKCDEAVPMKIDLCKRWHHKDTVLVDIEEYKQYLKMI
jgi:hypothetical protein